MTRDDILDAAAQVISSKGFHGASMADIADAVKLKKASLYHHVSSKQEILLALLDRALDLLIERIGDVAKQDIPADEKLRQMIRTYLVGLADNADLASVLLFEHRSLEETQRQRHIPQRDRFEALWRGVIKQGNREGIFNCPDPALTVRAMMGSLNWTITWFNPKGTSTIEQIADQYFTMLFKGLQR